ncbi:Crp/Fnr family transcriptional regulator [Flammeovirga kamogawensis]|uniref:Crp/Fnr family transcriptional regulator n=1 Tax=Flammeovirga kamogawensis TaxID=373891 RepID=A0ABX8GXH8_9BACT|nr:Crp/Fnr family transcriptional regulator [Flammeovirga kamogawensis]MBB6460955.1 CRP-like cAMP-binding protein [Flammeovirga kamogawensis]QWG08296.1 Crp/Fnr family transcriptional regulator [Flammeovirga kamogawensis]TRX66594.1 Crp/Fnr family transcriptional regulator [Flammeovirga kamogawensis]
MNTLINLLYSTNKINYEEKTFQRGEHILAAGGSAQYIYIILSGCVRVIYTTKEEEHTIRLGYENSIIASLPAFFTNTPSLFSIEVIRKSTVRFIDKKNLSTIINTSPELSLDYQKLLEDLVRQQVERELDLLTVSPAERIQRVIDRSPQVFQEVPLKYIAYYLRMSPETLSRILSTK